jgi:hypothetical protein
MLIEIFIKYLPRALARGFIIGNWNGFSQIFHSHLG